MRPCGGDGLAVSKEEIRFAEHGDWVFVGGGRCCWGDSPLWTPLRRIYRKWARGASSQRWWCILLGRI